MRTAPAWCLFAVMTACDERPSHHFADLAEAMEQGAVERGWIPEGLPEDSRDIWLKYDLDTNATIVRLLSESWIGDTGPEIVPEPIGRDQVRFNGFRAVPWWPKQFPDDGVVSFFRFPDRAHPGIGFIYGTARGDTVYLWRSTS